ncbi:MAG: isopeptide-forming domain-containing fimbrial protein [Candidatus Brocadiae bacterium]|nr:isopeptide-forming domain-containing fimbrial protein [Candidatus Brocadiia bacterium]
MKYVFFFFVFCTWVMAQPSANIQVTGPANVSVNDQFVNGHTYTVRVTNTSADQARDLTIEKIFATPGFVYLSTLSAKKNGINIASTVTGNGSALTPLKYAFLDAEDDLNQNDYIEIQYKLAATCNAIEGANNHDFNAKYKSLDGTQNYTTNKNYTFVVLGGVLSVQKKALRKQDSNGNWTVYNPPTTTPIATYNENIEWQISLINNGLGSLYNVYFEDAIGTGMSYVSGDLTKTIPEIAADTIENILVTTKINSCFNLSNTGKANHSCNATYVTAEASVKYLVRQPNINYVIGDMTIPYGGNVTVTIPITNTGLGSAKDFVLDTTFNEHPLTLSNVSANFLYNSSTGEFTYTNNSGVIYPNDMPILTFRLTAQNFCVDTSDIIIFTPVYKNECDNEFAPPHKFKEYSVNAGPTLSLAKSATSSNFVEVGQPLTYQVVVSTANEDKLVGNIVITDNVPAAFVIDSVFADAGTVGQTGQNITWTLSSAIANGKKLTIVGSVTTDPCYAGQSFTNTANAAATTIAGCTLNSSNNVVLYIESLYDTAVYQDKAITSPVAHPADGYEAGKNITYTNTYTLGVDVPGSFTDSMFTESLQNSQTYIGSPEYSIDGVNFIAIDPSYITETSPNLKIKLDFLKDVFADDNVKGKTFYIRYTTRLNDTSITSGSKTTFVDPSILFIKGNTGSCNTLPGTYYQGINVTVSRTKLTLAINAKDVINSCEDFDIDLVVGQETNWPTASGENVVITYYQDNYVYISLENTTGFNGKTPIIGNSGSAKTFTFVGQITEGGTLTLHVVRKCLPPGNSFNARLDYKDGLAIARNETANSKPTLINKGSLELLVTPEEIAILTKDVVWRMIVTNKGSGATYNTKVINRISGLFVYKSSTIDGVNATPDSTVDGLSWDLGSMLPNETKTVEIHVELSGTTCDLANASRVTALFGCQGENCDIVVLNKPVFTMPTSSMQIQNLTTEAILLCGSGEIIASYKNTSTVASYNNRAYMDFKDTGLAYIPNTSEVKLDNGTWVTLQDPVIDGNILYWPAPGDPQANLFYELAAKSTLTVRFQAQSDCDFYAKQSIDVYGKYNKPCELDKPPQNTTATLILKITLSKPNLTITKKGRQGTESFSDTVYYNDNTLPIEWQISIKNTGDANAQNVNLQEAILEWLAYIPGSFIAGDTNTPDPITTNFPNFSLEDIPIGETHVYVYKSNVNTCDGPENTTSKVSYGCNQSNGSPDPCSIPASEASATIVVNAKTALAVNQTLENFNTCQGKVTITIANTAAKAVNILVKDTLPTGYIYDASAGGAEITSSVVSHTFTEEQEEPQISGDQRELTWGVDPHSATFYAASNETLTIVFYVKTDGTHCDTDLNNDPANVPLVNNAITVDYKDLCDVVQTQLSNITSIDPVSPDLDITITAGTENIVGLASNKTSTWTMTVTNNGDAPASNYNVVLTVGSGFSITNAHDGTISGQTITWTSGVSTGVPATLNAGASFIKNNIQVTVKTNPDTSFAGGSISSTVVVTGKCKDQGGFDTCNYSLDQAKVNIAGVDIVRTPGAPTGNTTPNEPAELAPGQDVTYRVTVTFFGDGDYSSVSMINGSTSGDTIPSQLKYPSAASAGPDNDATFTPLPGPGVTIGTQAARWNFTAPFSIAGTAKKFQVDFPIRARSNNVFSNSRTHRSRIDFTVTFGDGTQTVFSNNNSRLLVDSNIRIFEPNLSIAKTENIDDPNYVVENQMVTYTVTLTNYRATYLSPAYDIVLQDTLPAGMRNTTPTITSVTVDTDLANDVVVDPGNYTPSYNSGTGLFGITFNTDNVSIPASTTLPGKKMVITYQAQVDAGIGAGLTLTNTANATYRSRKDASSDEEKIYTTANASTTLYTENLPSSTKTIFVEYTQGSSPPDYDKNATIGEKGTYIIEFSIPSGTSAYDMVFKDIVPNGLKIVKATASHGTVPSPLPDPDPVTGESTLEINDVGDLTGGTALRFEIEVRVLGQYANGNQVMAGDTIVNKAEYTYNTTDNDPSTSINITTNDSQIFIYEPNLSLTHTLVSPVSAVIGASDTVDLRITLQNSGTNNSIAYETKVTAVIPMGMRSSGVVSSSHPYSYDILTGIITWDISQIAAESNIQIDYQLQADATIGAGRIQASSLLIPAKLEEYFSLPDSSGNPDRRMYGPLEQTITLTTPMPELQKSQKINGEATAVTAKNGDTMEYTILVPKTQINATLFNPLVEDTVPDGLVIQSVSHGTWAGRKFTANKAALGDILPNEQRQIVVTALVSSTFESGAVVPMGQSMKNTASFSWDNHGVSLWPAIKLPSRLQISSNEVVATKPGILFAPDNITTALPGQTVYYRHILKNFAVEQDNVRFNIDLPTSQQGWSYLIYRGDGSGNILSGPIVETIVDASTTTEIIVKGFVPQGISLGIMDAYTLTAVSTLDSNIKITKVDIVTVTSSNASGLLRLTKTVDKSTAIPGEILHYRVEYKNIGTTIVKDVILHDPISYVVEIQASFLDPDDSKYKEILWIKPDGNSFYLTADVDSDQGSIENNVLYLRMGALEILPGQTGRIEYKVKVK